MRAKRARLPDRHQPWWVPGLVGLGIALAFTGLLLTWLWRAPPSLTFSGWFQGDMPTYVCYGRMASETASTLSYANPHDIRDAPAPLLVNLPISVIGWLLTLGVVPGAMGHVLRILFGALMYAALGALLRNVFKPGRWFWAAFITVGLGSGVAWIASAYDVGFASDFAQRWRDGVSGLERPYYWWFLDSFRNLMYPLELAYHAIVFAELWALGARRWRLSVLLCALACLSNPFVGIQASAVQAGALALATRQRPRPSFGVLGATALVVGLFGLYYGFILPADDVIRSVQEQHQANLDSPLTLKSLLVGHGPALLAPIAVVLDASFRRVVWRRFALVPVLLLAGWTLLLSQNSRFGIDFKLMPMHFTRGYLHAALWIVSLAWIQHRLAQPSRPQRGAAVALAIALLLLPDALLFVEDQYRIMPHEPSLVWPAEWQEVHMRLRAERAPQRVIANSFSMGRQICALHEHRSAIGTPLTTPHYAERQAELARFRRDPLHEPPLIAWATRLLVYRDDPGLNAAARRSPRWQLVFDNGTWSLYERVNEPVVNTPNQL